MGNQDGMYFCNSPQGRSAIAYYSSFSLDDDNNGQQPDALVYTSNGSDHIWEGSQQSFTFNSGVTVNFFIESNGFNQSEGTIVGSASNSFETFEVRKFDGRFLVTDNDGVQLEAIYAVN